MEFRVLGPVQVEGHGGVRALRGARQRRLLAALLLDVNAVVPTEQLIDQLWDDPPDTARQQVHNAVAALRRWLGDGGAESTIVTDDIGYRIVVRPEQFDLACFLDAVSAARAAEEAGRTADAVASLGAALGHWRGPAFAGVGGARFANAAARLAEQRLAAREKLLSLRLDLGEHEQVIGELTELVASEPLRESPRRSLMLALYRSGRQSDALQVYREGRQALAAELGLDPGPELVDLHSRVLRGDPELLGDPVLAPHRDEPAVPVVAERPSFLPHGTRDFTGRDAELDLLLAELTVRPDSGPVILAIDGMGGVGKTTLAVHLGHRLEAEFPDGHYFVDLHGYTAGRVPLTPAAALDLLLRSSGYPAERIQDDLTARAAQWRSHLAGRRVLLVLDNAVDEDQVRHLLPGTSGAVVLVTSRHRMSGLEAAVPVSLDVLPHDHAVELFTRVAGLRRTEDELADVAEVVRLCGRLPLAIRVAASRLRHRLSWTAGHLARLLRDESGRARLLAAGDRSVAAVLEVSYRHLDDAPRRLLALLGVHPGTDFDPAAVSAVGDVELLTAEDLLDGLVQAHLVTQHSPGRYRLHDLVRDFARSALRERGDDERLEARHRLFDHYLHLAGVCCGPIARGFSRIEPDLVHPPRHVPVIESEPAAMELLKAELQNLVATARAAIEEDWTAYTWQLPCVLEPFFSRVNYRESSLDIFRGALEAARRHHSVRGEAAALTNIALILRDRGWYDEVRRLLLDAIGLTRRIDDEPAVAYLLANLGIAHIRAGDLPQASETFSQAREIAMRLEDRQGYAAFTNNIGAVSSRMGHTETALHYFSEALGICRDLEFHQGEAITLINIGEAHLLAGRAETAVERLASGLGISKRISYHPGSCFALSWLGAAHRELGDLGRAHELGTRALELSRGANIGEVECDALAALGETALAAGQPAEAGRLFEEARTRSAELHLPLLAGRACEGLAHVALAAGDEERARRHWETALGHYPAGIAAAGNARDHLAALGGDPVSCQRCRTVAAAPGIRRVGRE
ncbi:tetratricopeptide repeat protein [Amycolatopsis sp. OK19-0408]|uniref:Tetratricopeptide repeat protein n=1 Tax=Amycolatopsis iheyensis TaxID=2945988 RepID=A0A9X2SL30_9PSEU|nr:BTAD domain-containing putative transcriptional regulator [Amycolatopsis iheyensis]MCR6485768.1 tetratricopeptide repeat protein [Amycolatopsis iheyensis]